MLKLLYGTSNISKFLPMKKVIEEHLPIQMVSLSNITQPPYPKIAEVGNDIDYIVKSKAMVYFELYGIPTVSTDYGLYLEGVPDDLQPGAYIRRVNGKSLTDAEMFDYYINLVNTYGNGELKARYENALFIVFDRDHKYSMHAKEEEEEFILSSIPHSKVMPGYPLDSMAKDIQTGKYYFDIGYTGCQSIKQSYIDFIKESYNDYLNSRGL